MATLRHPPDIHTHTQRAGEGRSPSGPSKAQTSTGPGTGIGDPCGLPAARDIPGIQELPTLRLLVELPPVHESCCSLLPSPSQLEHLGSLHTEEPAEGQEVPGQTGWRIIPARIPGFRDPKAVCQQLCPPQLLPPGPGEVTAMSQQGRGQGATHVADLILSLFDPLQLGGVGHHAEAFALVLLELLLVADLGGTAGKRD